jgi:ATPase subunit of ABC transporter with duplicated ATPase domains
MASYQYVYHMENVSKTYPGGKKCFREHPSQLPARREDRRRRRQRAGKSTLLKIMAGIDTDFKGEAWAAKGAKVGYLAQEPQLDPTLTSRAT